MKEPALDTVRHRAPWFGSHKEGGPRWCNYTCELSSECLSRLEAIMCVGAIPGDDWLMPEGVTCSSRLCSITPSSSRFSPRDVLAHPRHQHIARHSVAAGVLIGYALASTVREKLPFTANSFNRLIAISWILTFMKFWF